MSRNLLLATAAAAILFAGQANATAFVFETVLLGANEVPFAATPGTGTGRVTFDDVWNTMRVETSFSGLLGTTTVSHIHCCQPAGINAGVATTTPTFTGFPAGATSGSYDHTFDMTLANSYNAAFVTANGGTMASAFAALLNGAKAGNAYLNIHTTSFAGGEIRGQLSLVPEPQTWALMIAGFGMAGAALRRRKAAPLAA
ncbi:CHRD domain-containing protein [Phenylobacterium sp. LH3H17]|nr:CHRD domain-containing protein [Phenylobacterium sp. LH3H17]UTP41267.1 CHRD domain-containing protein [Phenylobacterium sp. LH3H17]